MEARLGAHKDTNARVSEETTSQIERLAKQLNEAKDREDLLRDEISTLRCASPDISRSISTFVDRSPLAHLNTGHSLRLTVIDIHPLVAKQLNEAKDSEDLVHSLWYH